MLFLVLLNVWCSQPGFLKTAPHPTPSIRAHAVSASAPSPGSHFWTGWPAAAKQHGDGERSQSSGGFRKTALTQRGGICIQLRERQLQASFSPPCKAEASRAVQPTCEGTHGPSSHPACGKGCRDQRGRNAKGGRAEGAGDMGWSWNYSAFLW